MPDPLDYESPPPPKPPITATEITVFVVFTAIATLLGIGAYIVGL